jgi:ABC-type siderophore export system fused ATPase/permease subunit
MIVEAIISLRRVQKFLVCEDKPSINYQESESQNILVENLSVNGSCYSSSEAISQNIILRDIGISVRKRELVIISGKVGSGKCMYNSFLHFTFF